MERQQGPRGVPAKRASAGGPPCSPNWCQDRRGSRASAPTARRARPRPLAWAAAPGAGSAWGAESLARGCQLRQLGGAGGTHSSRSPAGARPHGSPQRRRLGNPSRGAFLLWAAAAGIRAGGEPGAAAPPRAAQGGAHCRTGTAGLELPARARVRGCPRADCARLSPGLQPQTNPGFSGAWA